MSNSTGAKLPGLFQVSSGNTALDRWMQAVTERLEVREGSRGSDLERVVTWRDMENAGFDTRAFRGAYGNAAGNPQGVMTVGSNGQGRVLSMDEFMDSIRKSKLYVDLVKRLDDATRFDGLPDAVKSILLTDLATEARKRGADIQRLEYKIQDATQSLAYTVEEVTAAVASASAGVRDLTYASATADEAQAGKITQIQARLDDFNDGEPGTVTIEQSLIATANRVQGLSGEYMVKINAGKAAVGFGMSASEDPSGATRSDFIVSADNFAIASPTSNVIPFGVDTRTGKVYINGSLTVGKGGADVEDVLASTYKDYVFIRAAGTPPSPPSGWSDTPPAGSDPLYMSCADRSVTGDAVVGSWSTPVRLDSQGQVKGVSFLRADVASMPSGGSFTSPNASPPWSDGIPADNGKPLWMSSCMFTSDGRSPQGSWTTPSKVGSPPSGTRFVFSVGSTGPWHTTPAIGDSYMATQTSPNNLDPWSVATGITQIKGESGQYTEARYATGTLTEATGDWGTTQPTIASGVYMWMKTRVIVPSVASPISVSETSPPWGTAVRISGEEGKPGASGFSVSAYAVYEGLTVAYNPDKTRINTDAGYISLSASCTNPPAGQTLWYEWVVNGSVTSTPSTSAGYSYDKLSTYSAASQIVKVNVYGGTASAADAYLGSDTLSVACVMQGGDGITIQLDNSTHVLPTTTAGVVTYTGSGTTIKVYEGATQLTFDGQTHGDAVRHFAIPGVAVSPYGLSPAEPYTITGAGSTTATMPAYSSGMTDVATVTFTIDVKNSNGGYSTYTAVQSLAKAKQGDKGDNSTVPGAPGDPGAQGTRGTLFAKITTAWDATGASNAIYAIANSIGATPTTPIKGDIVYYVGGAKEYSISATTGVGSWSEVAAFINGSLVVKESIAADRLMAGTVSTFSGSSVVDIGGTNSLGSYYTASLAVKRVIANTPVGLVGIASVNNKDGGAAIWGSTITGSAVVGTCFTSSNALPTSGNMPSNGWNALAVLGCTWKNAAFYAATSDTAYIAGLFEHGGSGVALQLTGKLNANGTTGTDGQILKIVGGVPKWVTP